MYLRCPRPHNTDIFFAQSHIDGDRNRKYVHTHTHSPSTLVSPQLHVKDPGHSAKSAGGRSHLNTHTPLTQRSRSGLTMLLSRHSVGTYSETSSHATCQGKFGHSSLSSLSHRGLILAQKSGISVCELSFIKILKKRRRGMNDRPFSPNPRGGWREGKPTKDCQSV